MMVCWANVQNNKLVKLCRLQTILLLLFFQQMYIVHTLDAQKRKKKNQHYIRANFSCTESKSSVIDDIHAHKWTVSPSQGLRIWPLDTRQN
jgi:hypothetical protein